MSICIVGKSNSGKDTVVKELCNIGYTKAITYTTRPPRIGEIIGKDYNFISENEFIDMINNNKFLEYRKYNTKNGEWYYGSCLEDIIGENKVIILTPDGAKKLKEKVNIATIYLQTSNKEIKRRMKNRIKSSGENKKELKRRYKADKKDFKHIEVDFIIQTDDKTPNEVAKTCISMDYLYKKHGKW